MCAGLATMSEVAVEALLENESGPGDVRPEGDHDHGPPAVMRRQTAQLPPFPVRGWRIVSRVASKLSWRSPARDLLCGEADVLPSGKRRDSLTEESESINT